MRRIALVAPQAVPSVFGGAENLWAGLLTTLNETPGVSAEFITLPTPETNLKEVLAGYAQFAKLDLFRFDQVISTKYPAWAVSHPHHTVYLQHTLRGLYDTYPKELGFGLNQTETAVLHRHLPAEIVQALQLAATESWQTDMREQAAKLAATLTTSSHSGPLGRSVANLLSSVLEREPQEPSLACYPGPYARACVRLLDAIAFQRGRIHRFFAISQTVANRSDYFPDEALVTSCHHPTFTAVTQTDKPKDLIVTASRLENPKRVDLLIDAYIQSGVTLPFWIVGDGPSMSQLKERAGGHPEIVFKGKLSESELVDAYQRALFVPFAPRQEDYGLITVEAFLAGAAVLTTSDSGGPTELVRHQESGWISLPTVESLAEGFRVFAESPETAQAYGESGQKLALQLQWPALLNTLINTSARKRRRVLVVNTFPTEPTNSGGRLRMKGLYQALSRFHDVHMLSLGDHGVPHTLKEHLPFAPGRFTEEIIPVSAEFVSRAKLLSKQTGASCGDIAVSLYPETLTEYRHAMQRGLTSADCVVFSHPYIFPVYEQLISDQPQFARQVIYEAHNVESDLKGAIYPKGHRVHHGVKALEMRLLKQADLLIACSDQDAESFRGRMNAQSITSVQVVVCENGIDLTNAPFADLEQRFALARETGRQVALFMGSDHGPNHDAFKEILKAAQDPRVQADWKIVVLGSVVHPWQDKSEVKALSDTLVLRGVVSEAEKNLWLTKATMGLNPILTGSGTNLKLADYAACGLPMLSTHFGARGGIWQAWAHYLPIEAALAASLVEFHQKTLGPDATLGWLSEITRSARDVTERRLNWVSVGKAYARALDAAIPET